MMTRNKLFAVTGLAAALAFSGWSAFAQSGTLAPPGPPPPPEEGMMFFSTEGPGPGGPAEGIVVMGFEGGFDLLLEPVEADTEGFFSFGWRGF